VIDYSTYDDLALLRAIAQPEGEVAAFTIFYKRHSKQVYRSVLTFVKDPLEAEEAVQELFARIWHKRQHLDIKDNVTGYLVQACRNQVIDKFRKVKKERDLLENLEAIAKDSADAAAADARAEAFAQEQYEILQRAMAVLSPQRRKIFELCKIKGISYAEAAAELGINVQSVKDHLQKAKAKLRDHLAGEGEVAITLLILLDLL
jgi:RNA polymerase sigma-70 factor (ECF subfamily)